MSGVPLPNEDERYAAVLLAYATRCTREVKRLQVENAGYRAALAWIRDEYGATCSTFEACEHPLCRYGDRAWAHARDALMGAGNE